MHSSRVQTYPPVAHQRCLSLCCLQWVLTCNRSLLKIKKRFGSRAGYYIAYFVEKGWGGGHSASQHEHTAYIHKWAGGKQSTRGPQHVDRKPQPRRETKGRKGPRGPDRILMLFWIESIILLIGDMIGILEQGGWRRRDAKATCGFS